MALGQRLELKQGQGLVITPQLQQAIKLLQLSNLELEAVIETELERNPLLQRDDAEPVGETEIRSRRRQQRNQRLRDPRTGTWRSRHPRPPTTISMSPAATSMATTRRRCVNAISAAEASEGPMVDWSKAGKGGGGYDGDEDGLERSLSREKTLGEHLTDQALIAHLQRASENGHRPDPDRCRR